MNGTAWFYNATTGRRTLLIEAKADSSDKDVRGLGGKVAKTLQTLKIAEVDFVVSKSVAKDNYESIVGHFESSFMDKNFQDNRMRPKEAKEGEDPRKSRNLTNVEKYNFIVPDKVDLESVFDYKFQTQCVKS